jgi:hypothetical protein
MGKYVDASPNRWRAALAGRSRLLRCQIHPAALARLRDADGVLAAGAAVASRRDFDLVVADDTIDRVYVDPAAWPELSPGLGIRMAASGSPTNLTVVLPHLLWPFSGRAELPDAALAADLLDDLDTRVERAGAVRLNELLRAVVTRGD